MASLEDEIRDLKEKNNELVQKVQYWKVAAATKENEKLELMKEINELRLKLSRLRSGGAAQARKLDAALQSASEEALSHLVQASSAVANSIEMIKSYMRDRQELEAASPRWSAIGGTPNTDRVHRVPPMLIGGQSIQPVVSLSRTLLNGSNSRSLPRSPNQNRSITERAVPMHMLQDVYIPLTRIDATELLGNNMDTETEVINAEDSTEDLGLNDSSAEGEEFETSSRLEAVSEDIEPEDVANTPPRSRIDNPLEGPSWLLDRPSSSKPEPNHLKSNLEPDSTTELDEKTSNTQPVVASDVAEHDLSVTAAPAFTPTVRRRKRATSARSPARSTARSPAPSPALSPALSPSPRTSNFSPRPLAVRRNSNSGRVLKVLVAKMRLDSEGEEGQESDSSPPRRPLGGSPPRKAARAASPAKRLMRFDAPSPNGATDAGVIVEHTVEDRCARGTGEPVIAIAVRRDSRVSSHGSRKGAISQDWLATAIDGQSSREVKPDSENLTRMMESDENSQMECDEDGRTSRLGIIDHVTHRGNSGTGRNRLGNLGDSQDSRRVNVGDSQDSRRINVGDSRDSRHGSIEDSRDNRLGAAGDSQDSRLGVGEGHSRMGSVGVDSRDSDSSSSDLISEGRTRRPRKAITYKEKPLNRKMRR